MDEAQTPLGKALLAAGSQAKLALIVGMSQPAIAKAKKTGSVSPLLAVKLEKHFGIPCHESRPDVWDAPRPVSA